MQVIVIGGGAAGMIAAITAAKNGNKVTILEKMNSLGKKLLITGKGRCNITSSLPIEEFINNVPGNGKFLYSAFKNFTNKDIIDLLKEEKVEIKEERGNRIFPVSDKAQDVLNALISQIKKNNVEIKTNSEVEEIILKIDNNKNTKKVQAVKLKNGLTIQAEKVIIATGGKSYPGTGSTGDGYKLAQKCGHTITKIKPSLVPLTCHNESLKYCQQMQGLSLKNVKIQVEDIKNKKDIYIDFGEMLFTHFGISGPIVLSSSAHILRYSNIEELLSKREVVFSIDLKPALTEEKLNARILRDFEKYKNKELKNSLNELLPQKMIMPVIEMSQINEEKQVNSITKEERKRIVKVLKNFQLKINGFRSIEEAIITAGGINIKEIEPKTMESKIVEGLYFAGEVIDVDAYTGGFNLQIAYSTGYTAGLLQ